MKLLGIDFGKRKIGLSVSDGKLAEPYKVIRFKSEREAVERIKTISKTLCIEKVVIGLSEGEMAKKTENFAEKLEKYLGKRVYFQDETLTTHEAKFLSKEAGIKRKKRKALEDAYSATLILQAYIDDEKSCRE